MADGNGKRLRGRGSCATCEYAYRLNSEVMQCRRHAPTVLLMGMANNALGQPVPMTNGFFPPVNPDIWCGEFVPAFSMADFWSPDGAHHEESDQQ